MTAYASKQTSLERVLSFGLVMTGSFPSTKNFGQFVDARATELDRVEIVSTSAQKVGCSLNRSVK